MATTEMPRGRSTTPPTTPAGPFAAGTPVRRRRKRGFLALAAALVVLFAVGTYAAFTYFSATHSAIAVAGPVGYGHQIVANDLVEVSVPNGGTLNTLDWSQRTSIVGQYAATPLQPGQLLPSGATVAKLTPPAGSSLVAVALKNGLLPAAELHVGDSVRVVAVATTASSTPTATAAASLPAAVTARVYSISPRDAGGTTVVDVVVADSSADAVARLSALGQAALVLQPRG
jgi:hypothetical protein